MTEVKPNPTKFVAIAILATVAVGGAAFFVWPTLTPEPLTANQAALQAPDQAPDPVTQTASADHIAPTFDTFRLDPDGGMVVAGRATPGEVVELMLADDVIATAMADASGSFVMLTDAGPSDAPRRLSLVADPGGAALASEGSYLVAPIAAPVAVAAVEDMPVSSVDGDGVLADAATSAPVVVQADADGLRIVQGATDLPAPNVVLDAITYDPTGIVQLAGRATGAGQVQIYLDDAPISAAVVADGGAWRVDLPNVATGVYTLRIDEMDASGAVISRLETPFRREEAANVAAVMAEDTAADGFEVAVRTVQPGSTLWAIAEETLGSGVFYLQVFEANSDLIRDPDLIYPGQIFRIPDRAP